MTDMKRILKNEYVQTAIVIIVVVGLVFGLWYGSQIILNTQYPALAVASGSMCTIQHTNCDGSSHPFEQTLHVGDLIIIQGIPPNEIKAAPYPDGDIIVFRRPGSGLIVHRAVDKEVQGNRTLFTTKGDGNLHADANPVGEEDVIGKVILRIPWIGHIALLMRNSSGMFIIVVLIIILVVVEFIIPIFSKVKVWSDREEAENQLQKDES